MIPITPEGTANLSAWDNFTKELYQRRSNIKPPEPLSLSEWANKYAVLSKETSAQTGRFRSFAYQDGMMDAITDPRVTQVSVMKSARVGYTKILDHVIGYYLAHDPSPILVVQPRVEDAEDYSKTEITPMLRDTPALKAISGDLKAKSSNQTILKKQFLNGSNLTLVGANSPGGFRRITCRIILFDEVDGYPVSGAGVDGDQIALGTKRSETFWNRKIVLGSTPTVKGISRIEKAYDESDQRKYYVPCPQCGEYQTLEWGGPDTPYGIKWDKDADGVGLPDTAYYVCRHNGCVIHHNEKAGMVKRGKWQATKTFKGHAGFHIWAGYSLFPNAAWKYLVAEWLRVKDDALMRQTFINLVLGEPYEDRGEKALSEKKLIERCELFAAEVPDGVAVLTAGIDTQDDRFEIEVTGWGKNEESWSVAFDVIEGDLQTDEPWLRLDAYLKQIWRRADGRGFTIMAACMDSGGHHTQKVYEFAKERLGRRIWAIKGESARGGKRSPVWPTKKPSSRSKSQFRPIILGVNAAKDAIRSRLHIDLPAPGSESAGCMHFPADRDLHYFSQLLAERSVVKISGGQRYRVWEQLPGRANEALDCRVYSYAALCGLLHLGFKLNQTADKILTHPERLLPPPVEVEEKNSLRLPGAIIKESDPPSPKRIARRLA
ncbi:phage terminase large subunit family protein [Yersinia ruckeri]|uniref:Bacteriophage tail assembly protein n=1 Tax=Yersinia ruckeri TaxID=29486 RepID=A0A0A8VEG7_YERRU|nr:phage terminase large subunit family protein [Yersinia ruckeri]KGA51129.1 phage terminase large subunit family protein [Yersinia ruckeri ATCC 29473]MCK8596677.1 phage terminase large subunit family protein [Yersinia ruckeri]MCK8600006.1 phage terminase large subunit family protein [Yersinia ruckeri]MCW6521732.1 phage terminase large subunit family protein [Yersinia ruckeri]MCW6525307.1 phage terminase large subunit family protein [Yersinia ruckeri]